MPAFLLRSRIWIAATLVSLLSAAAPDPAWQRCEVDADCVASFGPCGEWVATGRAHLKEQQDWARREGRAMSCPVNTDPAPPVACREKRCVLTLKAH